MSKKYETPYGKKSGLLLALSMDAHCREDEAVNLITEMSKMLEDYAFECGSCYSMRDKANVLVSNSEKWLERRKANVKKTEEEFINTI